MHILEKNNYFKLFEQGPVERSFERLHTTIDSRGRMFFNKPALEAIGNPEGVALMYDEENKRSASFPRASRERKLTG